MVISQIPKDLWNAKRKLLEDTIKKECGMDGNIRRNHQHSDMNDIINFEGYPLPMQFDCTNRKLKVWSRSARGSGSEIEVGMLVKIQRIIDYWYEMEIASYFGGINSKIEFKNRSSITCIDTMTPSIKGKGFHYTLDE